MAKDSGGLPQSLIPKKGTLGGLRMELKGELSSLKKAPARLEKNQDAILAAVEKLQQMMEGIQKERPEI